MQSFWDSSADCLDQVPFLICSRLEFPLGDDNVNSWSADHFSWQHACIHGGGGTVLIFSH
eukprot:COSAG03_NODE_2167_length_3057_cov_9.477011_4_plen_59_part_01